MSVRRGHEELVVITKTYDLILWSCHHTGKFPRNHRFVLGERIERNLYDLLETLIRAKYTRQRQELLAKANLLLEILRFQMRLAAGLCGVARIVCGHLSAADELERPRPAGKRLSTAIPSVRYHQLSEGGDRVAVCCVAARSTTKRRTSALPTVTGTCRRPVTTLSASVRRVPCLARIRKLPLAERARVQSPGRRPVSGRLREVRPNDTPARRLW
jgi:hypothetical protein